MGYRYCDPVPIVEYTAEENETWGLVYDRLQDAQSKYACSEYLNIMPLMEKHCGYCRETIPQVRKRRVKKWMKGKEKVTIKKRIKGRGGGSRKEGGMKGRW